MISKATRFSIFPLILLIGFSLGTTACAPEGSPSVDGSGIASDVDRVGGELEFDTSALVNSQSVGAGGALHEKAVLGIQMLNKTGEAAGECSAVLIRDDAILLAAHCFDPYVLPHVAKMIVHTNHDMNRVRINDPASRKITRWFIHPLYNSRLQVIEGVRHPYYDNDIAIAFLDTPFKVTRPQLLAETYQGLVPGMTLTTYGYGKSFDWTDSSRTAAAKRTMTRQRGTFVISNEMVGDRYLTTRESKTHVCLGDSGGPAYLIEKGKAPVVVGLNSGSNGKIIDEKSKLRSCRGQSVILAVAPYRAWIDQTLMENRR